MMIIPIIIWTTRKSAKSCVPLNLLKPTGFSEGLGSKNLTKNICVNEMFLLIWWNQHAYVCIIANGCDVSSSNSHLKKGLDMFGVQMQTFQNMWLSLTITSVWQTQLQFYHQIRSLSHNRVSGDRLATCLFTWYSLLVEASNLSY